MPRRASPPPSKAAPADPAVLSRPGPRDRLLLAGEQLFAEHGLAVGIREITAAAGVNLAALHYYFGSKEGLLEAIFEARARPIARARLDMLAACQDGEGRSPLLQQVLVAYVQPAFVQAGEHGGSTTFSRLRARITVESQRLAQRIVAQAFNESSRAFLDMLVRLLPELTPGEIAWRFQFLLGAMFYSMADTGRIAELTGGTFDTSDNERGLACLVTFLAAGLSAPATVGGEAAVGSRTEAP